MNSIIKKIKLSRTIILSYLFYLIWIILFSLIIYGSNWDFDIEGPGNEFIPFFLLLIVSFIITWPWISYFNILGYKMASQQALNFTHLSKIKLLEWGILWPGIPLGLGILLFVLEVDQMLFISYLVLIILVGAYIELVPFFLLNDENSFYDSFRSATNIGKNTYIKNLVLHVSRIIAGSCLLVIFFLIDLSILVFLNFFLQDVLNNYSEPLMIVILGVSISILSVFGGFIEEKQYTTKITINQNPIARV